MSRSVDILIVEEDLTQAEHLKHILEQHDHKVTVTHNGEQALAALRTRPPEIVLSAVMMPLLDGYELCRQIKADEQLKDILVILLTSLSGTTDIIRGMECGADSFVTKPYDEELLMSRIEYIVLNRELRVGAGTQTGLEIVFGGQKYSITPERQQIVDLLIYTYETAVQKNHELLRVEGELNRLNEQLEAKVKERTAALVKETAGRQAAEASLGISEALLKEQHAFLRDVIDANPNPVFVKDQEGHFTLVNKAMAELYGTTTRAIIGKTDYDLNGKKEEVEKILLHDKEVIDTAQRIHIPEEEFTDQKTGEVSWFQTVRTPLINSNGQVRQILGVATDITSRKRAEEKLRESEEWLRAIFDASRDGILVEDAGVIVYVNQSYTRMLGYDAPEELLGRHISEILPPDEAKRLTEYGKARLRGETPPTVYEFKAKRKDGSLLDVEAAVSTATIAGKIYVITALREIAERKRTEEALATQQQYLREVVDANPNCIFIKDKEGRYTLVNQAQAELFGTSAENVIGKTAADFIPHQEDVERIFREDKEVRATLESLTIPEESFTDLKTGEARWFQTIKMPLLSPDGEKHLILGVATEITERKRIAETLQRSEEHLRSLIENATDIVSIVNADGVRRYISPSVERLLGYRPEELIGQNSFGLVHPEDVSELTALFAEGIKHPSRVVTREFRFRHKDGTWRTLEVMGRNLLSDPNVAGIIINSRDITERKLVEQALLDSEERLRQSQKMEAIGTLAGGVAHDFNNLLTAILGNTQLAASKLKPDDPLQLRLVEVEKAARRAAVLTRQLLAFSRRQILERHTINLNETIDEIMKLLQRIIGEDVRVGVKAARNLSPVFADPAQIEQVVMNLSVNARDAMPQGGRLTIETSNVELDEHYCLQYPYAQPGKYVQISVSDEGAGMDAETQARIFEPFFTTKEVGKGTGLGLSMVYGIVKQHEGHINVYSEVGQGTTVKVFLPAVDKPVEKATGELQLPVRGGTETILVADDEETLRKLAKLILEGLGYTVLLAQDGNEAVAVYEANRDQVDLLLLDVVMPHMGGPEAYERISELGDEVPLLFMTGYSSETVHSRFVKKSKFMEELNAVVLQKPYSVDALGRKVREVLDEAIQK